MTNAKLLKQKVLALGDRGVQTTRQLEKLTTETEILSLCIRRRLHVPGVTPNYQLSFRPINQYAAHNRQMERTASMDARRVSESTSSLMSPDYELVAEAVVRRMSQMSQQEAPVFALSSGSSALFQSPSHSINVNNIQSSNNPQQPSTPVPSLGRSQRIDNIQQLVASEIGRKWKQMGRALQFSEAFLDELEDRYPRSLQEKVLSMINALRQQCQAESELVERIVQALRSVGRNDLVRRVEQMR